MLIRVRVHVGPRGAALLFFALLDFLYGFSLFSPAPEGKLSASLRFVAEVAPLPAWGALWTAVGVACLAGAVRRRDWWAYAAAIGLKVLWGATFLIGWILPPHLERGWVAAVVWLPFAGLVALLGAYMPKGWAR